MKKIILSLLVLAAILVSLPQLFAAPGDLGNVVVHFKKWDSDYTEVGSWGWGHENWPDKAVYDGLDDFGAYFEFNDLPEVAPDNTETFGFIAVSRPGGGLPNWNVKYSGADINIPKTIVKGGETVHVYIFQGTGTDTTEDDPRYYVADNDLYNMFLVYFDPSGTYEENLGIHNWSGWTEEASGWANPLKVFTTGGNTPAGLAVKVALLQSEPVAETNAVKDAGLLIYAGGDANKKTGDVKLRDAFGITGEAPNPGELAPGAVAFAWVYSKGDAYTVNDNVLYDYDAFNEEAFTFRLQAFSNTDSGPTGTFAKNPQTIFVKTSAQVANVYATALPEDKAAAMAEMVARFELVEKLGEETFGTPIDILRVDFAPNNSTVSDFVINLDEEDALDNTKEYVLRYVDSINEAEIDLNLDTQGPEITFISPAGIVEKPAAERIINVPWGVAFNLATFPQFVSKDDRDGTLTPFVFVPEGPNSSVNTSVAGDYVIALQVSDAWGNVTVETFILRVTD